MSTKIVSIYTIKRPFVVKVGSLPAASAVAAVARKGGYKAEITQISHGVFQITAAA